MTVLKELASNKVPTNEKFRSSTSRVNFVNPLLSHECRPSFQDIMLICYKCHLTLVLLFDNDADGGGKTFTDRAYTENTSANKRDD